MHLSFSSPSYSLLKVSPCRMPLLPLIAFCGRRIELSMHIVLDSFLFVRFSLKIDLVNKNILWIGISVINFCCNYLFQSDLFKGITDRPCRLPRYNWYFVQYSQPFGNSFGHILRTHSQASFTLRSTGSMDAFAFIWHAVPCR